MGLEGIAHGGPGGMAALVEQGFLDGDKEVEGEDAEEDVAFDAALVLMVDGPLGERCFHVAEGVFGAGEEGVDLPAIAG